MRHLIHGFVLSAIAFAPIASAQEPATVGPEIYKQKFDNARVRAFEVTFEPGAKIGVHSHPDHLVYVIEGGTLNITGVDGKTQSVEAKAGDTLWIPAESHSANNGGSSRIKVLVVELKEAAPK